MASSSTNASLTLCASDLLNEVRQDMSRYPPIQVSIKVSTTWKEALSTIRSAIGDKDEEIRLYPRRTSASKNILRDLAAAEAARLDSGLNTLAHGLPIRTKEEFLDIKDSKKPIQAVRKSKIRAEAKSWPHYADPYPIHLRADPYEQSLAIVYGSLNLAGIDGQDSDPKFFSGTIPLLWDTGAHTSIIVEDMLTPSFRAYLQDKQHDDYRSQDQTRVQVDATVGFTNCLMELTTIFLVVPRRSVPNEYVGAIIGQRGFIDRLQYRSVPKKILIAMGETSVGNVWGDIILEQYLDLDDELIQL